MNTLTRPDVIILLRWTALFVLGWAVQWLLRSHHARWRVILWRGLLCACVAVPLMRFVPVPIVRIPIYTKPMVSLEPQEERSSAAVAGNPPAKGQSTIQPTTNPAQTPNVAKPLNVPTTQPVSIRNWALIIWGLGGAWSALRLLRIQLQLWRLRRESRLADNFIQEQARKIQAKLGVRRAVAVRVSDSVSSSFLCGLLNPAIMLPEKLIKDLSRDEIFALLAHEMAHVQQRDLFWCVGWQWACVVLWFHPLVWQIPTAHNLASEQEADRIACGHLENGGYYRQLLARLALRILALPAVETRLALNATSQIARRLNHLEQGRAGAWNWKYSVAGVALVCTLFLAVTGCQFSKAEQSAETTPAKFEFKQVQVIVQDQDGKPVPGASIKVSGFRVKGIHSPDAYSWRKDFGERETVVTDQNGKAFVKYPVMGIPEEKEYTGALTFHIEHPEFSFGDIQTFYIDGSEKPIHLKRGLTLEVSGYFGPNHQPVAEIVPNLTETIIRPEDWQKKENGVMAFHKVSPGGHLIQLMGRLPSGEIGYSDTVAFTAEKNKLSKFDLELKPGIRLEGRIDDQVPRPVKNGSVMISVRSKEFPALLVIEDFYNLENKYSHRSFWHSYRPIAEDGSFVFESVPPGEVDVIVLGDGFVSKSIGELHNRVNGILQESTGMAIPQAFPLVAPVTKIEVVTEPQVTFKFIATTKSGEPIEGVSAGFFPSAFRMGGKFGELKSSEAPLRDVPPLPDLMFSGKTDKTGKFVIRNLPAEVYGMSAEHPKYQVSLREGIRDRFRRVHFSPGETNTMHLVMDPKGTDFIGTAR